jgi:hypothetical protein
VGLANPRYERKYLAAGVSAAAVAAALARHPALFRAAFPPRTINNVYLDTPGLSDYQDHARGALVRTKTRIRWYGATSALACPTLERKHRVGLVGGKESFRLAPGRCRGGDPWAALSEQLASSILPDHVRLALHCRRPVLLNSYDRLYFVSADGRFRVTVDSRLRFARAFPFDLARLASAPSRPGLIVELKYEPGDAEEAEAVGHALPFVLGRFSKYITGVELLAQ